MFKAPSQLPPLSLLIDELPTRCMRQLARHLGISERTVKRYQEQDQAPRLVMLALFWETRWGQSVLDAEIFNRDQVQRGLVGALQRENAQLRATVARLVAAGDYGAANDPLWGVAACEGAKARPAAIHRPASGVRAAAGLGVLVDPAAQAGQLGQDHGGDDGAADQHQAFAQQFGGGGKDLHHSNTFSCSQSMRL